MMQKVGLVLTESLNDRLDDSPDDGEDLANNSEGITKVGFLPGRASNVELLHGGAASGDLGTECTGLGVKLGLSNCVASGGVEQRV
jgi:hypothetical protein